MSAYTEDYCNSHDIDCFALVDGKNPRLIHFASNGNPLPDWIDRERNELFRSNLFSIIQQETPLYEIYPHTDTVIKLIQKDSHEFDNIPERIIKNYLSSFEKMSGWGFYSYDMNSGKLYLIAEPIFDENSCREYLNSIKQVRQLEKITGTITVISENTLKRLIDKE